MDSDFESETLWMFGVNTNSTNYGFSELRQAIQRGNLEYLEQLHNDGVDLNARGPDGFCPLHIAAQTGKEDAVLYLLSYGADIDASSRLNETALYFAVKEGRVDAVKCLLQFGLDVNHEGNKKALYAAVHARRELMRYYMPPGMKKPIYEPVALIHDATVRNWQRKESCKKKIIFGSLLEYGFIYELEPACDPQFFHGIVELGYTEIVEDLLTYGADANMEYCEEYPLLVAIKRSQPDIIDLLLLNGADVNVQDGYGKTPIIHAARSGNFQLVLKLLTHGGTHSNYYAIVHAAIRGNSPEIVEELLNRGSVDINQCIVEGVSALELSLRLNFAGVITLLLDKGANVNERCGVSEKTPLHYASFNGDQRICEIMLKKGAKVCSKIKKKWRTPLHNASTPETVEILLRYGADINARDRNGRLPLHIASKNGWENVVDALLKNGADIDCTDWKGKTALHLIFQSDRIPAFRLLLNYGADVNICDKTKSIAGFCWINRDVNFTPHQIWELYVFHIVRMQASNCYVSEESLQIMQKAQVLAEVSEEDLKAERERCEEEIRKLQAKKLQNSNISFYECLTKNINPLAILLNNEDILQGLQSDDVSEEEFPTYALMLKTKFRKAMQRKSLVDQCFEIFGFLAGELVQFPASCAEAIMHYLSNQDLNMLIAAFKTTSQYSTETESMTLVDSEVFTDNSVTDFYLSYNDCDLY